MKCDGKVTNLITYFNHKVIKKVINCAELFEYLFKENFKQVRYLGEVNLYYFDPNINFYFYNIEINDFDTMQHIFNRKENDHIFT
jgi:hypothetical protein